MLDSFVTWAAPILSTLIIGAGQLWLNAKFKRADEKRDKARIEAEKSAKADEEWRSNVIQRMDVQDQRISTLLSAQCSQMRSDIIHKCHRYLDDMGCASVEEKQSLHAEYEDYQALCYSSGVENHFVDTLVVRTMDLPERDI